MRSVMTKKTCISRVKLIKRINDYPDGLRWQFSDDNSMQGPIPDEHFVDPNNTHLIDSSSKFVLIFNIYIYLFVTKIFIIK